MIDDAKLLQMKRSCAAVIEWLAHQDFDGDRAFGEYDSTCNALNVMELITAYEELHQKYQNRDLWDVRENAAAKA